MVKIREKGTQLYPASGIAFGLTKLPKSIVVEANFQPIVNVGAALIGGYL